jgi:predicted nucleic acid-binding protein
VLHTKETSGMNGTKFFFDTCAVINLLNQKYDLSSLGIDIDEAQLLTSVIVRMELLSKRGMSNRLPDSIIAATSIISNAILLTDDKDLLNLSWPGLRTQRIF